MKRIFKANPSTLMPLLSEQIKWLQKCISNEKLPEVKEMAVGALSALVGNSMNFSTFHQY